MRFCSRRKLSRRETDETVIALVRALQATIQFENAVYKELNSEYEQYIKGGESSQNQNRITGIPKIKGSISKCFENYTRPYVLKEEADLREPIFKELTVDLERKDKFVENTDELNIFNSSLVMFNKIKYLLERASKISRGKTIVDIYKSIKATIVRYLEMVRGQISKEELLLKREDKQERRFLLNLCMIINTVDYIKETINKMNDVFLNLVDEPFNQNLDFSEEEDLCAKICLEAISSVLRLYEQKLEGILTNGMLRVQWDKLENVLFVNSYINDLKSLIGFYSDALKERVNNVYLIRTFKGISEVTNNKFVEAIYRIKKINDFSVQQLHIGQITRFCRNQTTALQPRSEQKQRANQQHLQFVFGAKL